MGKICSKIYKEFFDKVKALTYSMPGHMEDISREFDAVAKELHIGKFTETFIRPKVDYDAKETQSKATLYISAEGFGDVSKDFFYVTGEKGRVILSFYPTRGYTWKDEELEDLEFIADSVYLLGARIQLLNHVKNLYTTDMLTGVLNTRGFMEHCGSVFGSSDADKYMLVFMNLKNFKYVNSTLGQRQADIILRKYANVLASDKKEKEKVGRLGGDNFIALIAKKYIDEFIDKYSAINFNIELMEGYRSVTVMARMAIYPIKKEDTIKDAMDSASVALAVSKKNSHNDVVWFAPEMYDNSIHSNSISIEFPMALQNREFVVYYQPKVNLKDNTLCGCEALARWNQNGTIVPPMEFIPVLEREGAICKLDFYVFDTVCADIRRWIDMGIEPVQVSVNFSQLNLHNDNLAEDIVKIMKSYDIDGKYIEIELTEQSGYDDYERLEKFVAKMKSYNITTSIDDFGTGYSSLNLLKNLDVDIIKLDKSLLGDVDGMEEKDKVIISHIIDMVDQMDKAVVAEGVENKTQLDILNGINCNMAQGYFFDKPMPCEEFEKRMTGERVYSV